MHVFSRSKVFLFFSLVAFGTIVGAFTVNAVVQRLTTHAAGSPNQGICSKLGQNPLLSSGARLWCLRTQRTSLRSGSVGGASTPRGTSTTSNRFSPNVNAADLNEDITPSGMRTYGQSETSIAAIGPYVVEAWNDVTAAFSPPCSPMFKDQGTGFGFSANGGASFKDLGGLPNAACATSVYAGDPGVETWHPGGTAYFYISSVFFASRGFEIASQVALTACKATGTGTSASLSCNSHPIIIASAPFGSDAVLDKPFLSIDPQRGRLYVSYTDIAPLPTSFFTGQIELAVCDIGTPSGGTGPAGGTAGKPVCEPGTRTTPYFVVAPGNPDCFQQGSYPAVDVKSGDVYVAWEFNFLSNCPTLPIKNEVARVPFSCLKLLPSSPCTSPPVTASVKIISMVLADIPGYNRFPGNDFPRIAVSDKAGTVSIVWDDARLHLLGDILLQSFDLVSLARVQATPVKLNNDSSGALHFLPALRNADANGNVNVSWYDRRPDPDTDDTNVFAALSVNPRTTSTPASNTRVTTVATGWLDTGADFIPNFGDYADNYVIATPSAPYTGETLYVAWSDGRLGVPQPFEAHGPTT